MSSSLPQFMNGVQLIKYGPAHEALQYKTDLALPKIENPYQILIKLKAAGVNPIDAKLAAGNVKLIINADLSSPVIIGSDFSGVVVEKGENVTEFDVGDEVFGSLPISSVSGGVYAQYTVADINHCSIAKKPSHLSFVQAAAVGIPLLTAYQGIIKHGNITDKNKSQKRNILIIGASGGVGSYSVQLAKVINPQNYVVGICSAKNAEFVKAIGADSVIPYNNKEEYQAFLQSEKNKFDLVFDCVGGDEYYRNLNPLLKKQGVYSTAVGPVEHVGSEPIPLWKGIGIISKILYRKFFTSRPYMMVFTLPESEFRTKIATLFDNKDFKGTYIDDSNIFPLKDVHKAHEKILSHRIVGKVVLLID